MRFFVGYGADHIAEPKIVDGLASALCHTSAVVVDKLMDEPSGDRSVCSNCAKVARLDEDFIANVNAIASRRHRGLSMAAWNRAVYPGRSR